jgi:5-methylcytosine-specific restriction endonuclease McrA
MKREWTCSLCGEVFSSRNKLVDHRHNVHKTVRGHRDNKQVEYECQFCGRKSNTGYGNSYHENRCKLNPNRRIDTAWNKGISTPQNAAYINEIPENILDLSKRTISKTFRRLKVGCSHCGWYVEDVVGDLHHIIPRKNGGNDTNNNIAYICPNCHRMVHSGKIDPKELISITEYIGDNWKEFVYYKKSEKLVKLTEHKRETRLELLERKNLILNSNIDFTKFGWLQKAANLMKVSHTQARRWIIKNIPELCVYSRKN